MFLELVFTVLTAASIISKERVRARATAGTPRMSELRARVRACADEIMQPYNEYKRYLLS
jgi:hypothetical protein